MKSLASDHINRRSLPHGAERAAVADRLIAVRLTLELDAKPTEMEANLKTNRSSVVRMLIGVINVKALAILMHMADSLNDEPANR